MAQELLPVGSETWTCGKEFADGYLAPRIEQVKAAFNQDALKAYASSLRDGRTCTLSSEFSVGTCNFVKKITFDDGVEWIARLRMPPLANSEKPHRASLLKTDLEIQQEKRRILYEMQSELDTIGFVRKHTDIPLPKVHGYNLDDSNPVGFPFSIIDYVHGTTAAEVSRSYTGDYESIPEEYQEKFWRQVANVILQLASIRLSKIGSIIRDPSKPDLFMMGPIVETSSGPYDSASEFYNNFPLALTESLFDADTAGSRLEELCDEQGAAFRSLASSCFSPATVLEGMASPGFGLTNWELSPHNILVDGEFNILAVIDWDSVIALPDAALYHFPIGAGMESAVPGIGRMYQPDSKREERCRRFAEIVEEVGQERSAKAHRGTNASRTFVPTKGGSYSKEAVAFRMLIYMRMMSEELNEECVRGLEWLGEHSEADIAQFYKIQSFESFCSLRNKVARAINCKYMIVHGKFYSSK